MTGCRSASVSDEGAYVRATAEARRQIAAGLCTCVVFTRAGDRRIGAVGLRRFSPVETAISTDTRFDIASLTKPFVATACACLVADGRLDPDRPFVDYLPEHAAGKMCSVTVRDLAMHVSGLGYRPIDSRDPAEFRRQVMSFCPSGERGTFCYSCNNYLLLGMIAERVSSLRLDQLVGRRVLDPLGLTETQWGPLADDGRFAQFAWRDNGPGRPCDRIAEAAPFPVGNAGLFSTAADLRRFAEAVLERRILPKAAYDLMLEMRTMRDGVRRTFAFDARVGRRPSGLGDRAVFHTGSTGQTLAIDPGSGFAAVVLTARKGDHDAAIVARMRLVSVLGGQDG